VSRESIYIRVNGENYSCKILTQTLMLAGQARCATVLGVTSTFGTPCARLSLRRFTEIQ
jgi:hypothetical protein